METVILQDDIGAIAFGVAKTLQLFKNGVQVSNSLVHSQIVELDSHIEGEFLTRSDLLSLHLSVVLTQLQHRNLAVGSLPQHQHVPGCTSIVHQLYIVVLGHKGLQSLQPLLVLIREVQVHLLLLVTNYKLMQHLLQLGKEFGVRASIFKEGGRVVGGVVVCLVVESLEPLDV